MEKGYSEDVEVMKKVSKERKAGFARILFRIFQHCQNKSWITSNGHLHSMSQIKSQSDQKRGLIETKMFLLFKTKF